MCWRQVSKLQKTVFIVLCYFGAYFIISYGLLSAEKRYTFVADDYRIGDKYAFVYLATPRSPVFSDPEGADVFESRKCGKCFITNNRGFLPQNEYDAFLFRGEKRTVLKKYAEFSDVRYPDKTYLLETSDTCVRNKLKGCKWEPRITSFATKETFNVCTFCDHIRLKRFKDSKNL